MRHWELWHFFGRLTKQSWCFRLMRVFQLTPLFVWLPILHQPKEGAVDSTFNEQSQTLSPASAGTASCLVDRASVELIMWFTLSQRLGCCCTGAENSALFVVITVWHREVWQCEWQRLYLSMEFIFSTFSNMKLLKLQRGLNQCDHLLYSDLSHISLYNTRHSAA